MSSNCTEAKDSGKRSIDDVETETSKRLCGEYLTLTGFYADRKGEREEMQDAHTIVNDFKSRVEQAHTTIGRLSFYGVYDGHAGVRASKYCSEELHVNLAKKFPKGDIKTTEKEIKRCFIDVFKLTDSTFLKQASKQKPSWKDGTTANVVLAINNTLYIANIGDSKAVLCRHSPQMNKHLAIPLSKDHSPTMYDERIRIQKAGGKVQDGRVMGVLEVSRSIGDGPYKNHGVTCIPEIKRCQIGSDDRYILIACDGLWKTFTNDKAIEFINTVLQDPSIEAKEHQTLSEARYEAACNRLASEAVLRLSADNVTVLIVAINQWLPGPKP